MSPNKAIEALKLINLKRVHPFYDWEEMREVRDTAIEALEKQIPKEPIGIDWLYCPNCRSSLDVLNFKKHCDECGQALDWSDTE